MSDPATFRLLAAAVYFVPALLWAVFAQSIWGFLRKRRPRSRAFVVLFIVGGLVALHYALWVLIALARSRATRVALLAASDADTAVLLALGRHFARLWPVRADPPRPGWLGVNYGVAALAAIVFVLADLGTLALPGATSFVPFTAYLLAMAALTVWDVQRLARSGAWQPGRLDEATSADVIALALGFALVAATVAADSLGGATRRLLAGGGASPALVASVLLHAGAGLVVAVPFVVRDLADTLRGFVTTAVMIAATAGLVLGLHALGARVADAELRRLLDLVGVLGVVLVLVPAQGWLGAAGSPAPLSCARASATRTTRRSTRSPISSASCSTRPSCSRARSRSSARSRTPRSSPPSASWRHASRTRSGTRSPPPGASRSSSRASPHRPSPPSTA